METITQFLSGTDILSNAVTLIGAIVLALAGRWLNSKTSAQIQKSQAGAVYDAICAGAASTYQKLYKDLKDKVGDGDLSPQDIDQLSEHAYREALGAAGDATVKQALRDMTDQVWTRLLQKAVAQLKVEGGAA